VEIKDTGKIRTLVVGSARGAYASPVPGETNTTNNLLEHGWVIVTIPGDINGDFKVSPQDEVLLTRAYGSTPQMPSKRNPNAEIDGNGVVGLSDLILLAIHYGQHNH
jgi:hypothetical protein